MTTEPESSSKPRKIYLCQHQQPSSPSLYFRLLLLMCLLLSSLISWSWMRQQLQCDLLFSFKWKRANRYRILARLWKIEVFLLYGVLRIVTVRNELICQMGVDDCLIFFDGGCLINEWRSKRTTWWTVPWSSTRETIWDQWYLSAVALDKWWMISMTNAKWILLFTCTEYWLPICYSPVAWSSRLAARSTNQRPSTSG